MNKKNTVSIPKKQQKNRFLLIFVCIFLGAALIFGSTLGIIIGVSEARAVASYNGIRIDLKTASYLASYYKYRYMSALSSAGIDHVRDTAGFWNSSNENTDGVSYGQLLKSGVDGYVRGIVAANYLYSVYGGLTKADEIRINNAVEEVLDYKANSDVEEFNRLSEPYGFDYKSFRTAAEMLYKAERVSSLLWGVDGSGLANSPADCLSYLETYSHVKLLFIRTETEIITDTNGDTNIVPLPEEEKQKRAELIDKIQSEIDGVETDADVQMSPTAFDNYIREHDEGVSARRTTGYYFHQNSDYSNEFSQEFPEVVEAALTMDIGEYECVETSYGVCFLYRYEVTDGDYLVFDDGTFSDFYLDGAAFTYSKILEEYSLKVNVKEGFSAIDVISLPYNSDLTVKY